MRTARVFALMLLFSLGCAHRASTPTHASLKEPPLARLPAGVAPTAYDLTLAIDPTQDTFSGRVLIQLKIDAPTPQIWLHGRGLRVTEVKYIMPEIGTAIGAYEQVTEDGVSRVRFPGPLPPGTGTLVMTWDAPFNKTGEGLYKVRDGDADYAFTQFEAQDARRAFPCFDEPSFKVPFKVMLVVPRGDQAITNTPVTIAGERTEATGPGTPSGQLIHFKSTPPLPTYLLAFAVGPFDVVTGPDIPPNSVRTTPIPLRGVATKGKGKYLGYALQHTGELVATLEKYFDLPYPYAKLDLIAVPDFAAGAMENAGAITFKEFLLLLDGKNAPLQQQRAYAAVTMHELAHQWFGDLVTMQWWDDIWLNEAFASWMAARAVNDWDPAQKALLDQLTSAQEAMSADSRAAARRIRQPVLGRDDVANAFDGITYSKGAGVIGMFERWVGEEAFRRGIHDYLAAHALKNATADDFLKAISQASGKDVAAPFRTFLDQPGVPFIDVKIACEGPKPALELQTSRYVPLGIQLNRNERWQTPVCVRYEASGKVQEQCALITEPTQRMELNAASCPTWVMPNAGGAGYYIFGLPEAGLRALLDARGKLTDAERLALVHSAYAAEGAGRTPYSVTMETVAPFAEMKEWRLLQRPLSLLEFARDRLVSDTGRRSVETYTSKLLDRSGALQPPTEKSDSDAQLLFRSAITGEIDVARGEKSRAAAQAAGLQYLRGQHSSDQALTKALLLPTYFDLALNTALEEAPAESFDAAVTRLRTASDPVERRYLLTALGRATGTYAEKARQLLFDPMVRSSELGAILWTQASRRETREDTWAWFVANFEKLRPRVSEGMAGALPWLGAGFCSEDRAVEVEKFFKPRLAALPGSARNLAATLEQIRMCAANVQANHEDAERYFVKERE